MKREGVLPVKIGLIGLGYWGKKLLCEYQDLSHLEGGIELTKVCDTSNEVLEFCSRKYQLAEDLLVNNPTDVIESENVDAIHIATPNSTHFPLCLEALERGKHVLVEKPMALTSRDAFRLARLSEERNLVLQVGHVFRFNSALKKAKQLIDSGKIGDVHFCDVSWTTYTKPFVDRGIIFDLAAHPVDILNFLLNEWPTAVYVVGANFVGEDSRFEDTALAITEFPQSLIAKIFVTWVQHGPKTRTITIVGSKGTLFLDALNQTMTSFSSEDEPENVPIEANNTIGDMISHFCACVTSGKASTNSALVGALVVRSLEAMREGLKKKERITIVPDSST